MSFKKKARKVMKKSRKAFKKGRKAFKKAMKSETAKEIVRRQKLIAADMLMNAARKLKADAQKRR